MSALYCIDLFAGAGGISIGLEEAGFTCLYANEVSPIYSTTLEKSHKDAFVETGDIRAVDAASVRRTLQLKKGELSLLAGGPPCQGFSVNAPVRSSEDERNHLFRDYLRFVKEFEPATVLIENVPGMISYERGQTVREILRALSNLGYDVAVRILYAPHYGVPQMRWRTIFLGNRVGIDPHHMFPLPTHYAKGRANFAKTLDGVPLVMSDQDVCATAERDFLSVAEAISDLPCELENGASSTSYFSAPQNDFQQHIRRNSSQLFNHEATGLGPTNLARLPYIPPGGSWRDIPFELLPAGMKRARRSDHTKRYGRLHPDGIASTILTKCDPHWGSYIHPSADRIITVREAARFQTFPDHIHFYGSLADQYKQVGNAVPPFLSKAIGKQIITSIFSNEQPSIFSRWHDQEPQLNIAI